jgi:hypothetical protein
MKSHKYNHVRYIPPHLSCKRPRSADRSTDKEGIGTSSNCELSNRYQSARFRPKSCFNSQPLQGILQRARLGSRAATRTLPLLTRLV